jgi:hypothetical protein
MSIDKKYLEKKDKGSRIDIIAVLLTIIVILLLFRPPENSQNNFKSSSKDPLEEEYEWYQNNGYSPLHINYIEVLDALPPAKVDQVQVTRETLRSKASEMKDVYSEVIISWCPDEEIICLVGEYDTSSEIIKIFYWAPR